MYCRKCGKELKPNIVCCDQCGSKEFEFTPFSEDINSDFVLTQTVDPTAFSFKGKYGNNLIKDASINKILRSLIDNYFKNHHISPRIVTKSMLKTRLTIVFISSLLNMVLMGLYFFHVFKYTYIIIALNIILATVIAYSVNVKNHIIKQIKACPDIKFNSVISNALCFETSSKINSSTSNTLICIACYVVSFLIPCIIFFQPHFIYEYQDNNTYCIRYYTTGVINPDTIEVPSSRMGITVTQLRGDLFRNVKSVKTLVIPDTVTTINGNICSGATHLEEVTLSSNLTYLGGGAFRDCKSLKSIIIPDSVTELRGETFINCSSLKYVYLSANITEIRGNTFENCTSLQSIEIPDGVFRIGAYAFYGCSSLHSVSIPDSMREIGSSAFRLCPSLYTVSIPSETSINERAFKESPTSINLR